MKLQAMQILREWHARIRVAHKAHIKSAAKVDGYNKWLGVPATILAAIVGTAVFASWENASGTWLRVFFGLLSVAAAVLASLQTSLNYKEVAEFHRKAAGRYAAIRRKLEEMLATYTDENPCDCEELEPIGAEWADIEGSAPSLSQRLYEKIRGQVERDEARRK